MLKFTFPTKYPDEAPEIELPSRSGVLDTDTKRKLLNHLDQTVRCFKLKICIYYKGVDH